MLHIAFLMVMLMNTHVLPYTDCTNSTLTKVVDQLIQQFSHPIVNTTSTISSSTCGILSSGTQDDGSCDVVLVDPLGWNTCAPVISTSMPVLSDLVPLMTSTSLAANLVNNLALTTHAMVDLTASQVPSSPPVTSSSSASSFYLRLHDLHCIYAPQLVAREGVPCNITNVPSDEASIYKTCALIKALLCDIDMAHVVYHLQTSGMTGANLCNDW